MNNYHGTASVTYRVTPTLTELLTNLIEGKEVYDNEAILIELDKENLVQSLYNFINENNYDSVKGYNIDVELYKIPKTYTYSIKEYNDPCANCRNNPAVNPNASGVCNCTLPYLYNTRY